MLLRIMNINAHINLSMVTSISVRKALLLLHGILGILSIARALNPARERSDVPPINVHSRHVLTRGFLIFFSRGRGSSPSLITGVSVAMVSMKVVILVGGLGTRLTEETETRPKPMVEIGGRPILWHIMKLYSHFGFREFVVALGYKGDVIKRYFLDYAKLQSNFTVNLASGDVMRRGGQPEDWTVHLVDTGVATNTGGRLKRLAPILGRETFMATYGDGVSNVDINALVQFHQRNGKLATTVPRGVATGPLWRPGFRGRPDR